MAKPKVLGEDKADKFKRIASYRTQRMLTDLRLLGNCANRSTYSYSETDVNKIFGAIEKELKRVRALFASSSNSFNL